MITNLTVEFESLVLSFVRIYRLVCKYSININTFLRAVRRILLNTVTDKNYKGSSALMTFLVTDAPPLYV